MNPEYQKSLEKAVENERKNEKLVRSLKRKKDRQLDPVIHDLHEEVFQEIDCLECANCCSTTSPIFRDVDIKRLSKHLRIKEVAFIEQYLHRDDVGDYVLNSAPCPFLGGDNYCSVYDQRPGACRDYPHTNRKRQGQIMSLNLKNTLVCPAVARIFERLG